MRTRAELAALTALLGIVCVTIAWWALALWPLPGDAPVWLTRTRVVCFGSLPNGLPNGAGWMLLIGQPLSMLVFLIVVWGAALRAALRGIWQARLGKAAYAFAGASALLCVGAAGVRVASAAATEPLTLADTLGIVRLDETAPDLSLTDQRGRNFQLRDLRGRIVIVGFVYAHCQTVCPLIIRDMMAARAQLAVEPPALVFVTLDPWRDTPARLPHVAAAWGVSAQDYVLSGTPEDVNRVLDDWKVGRVRDERTGEVAHSTTSYVIGRDGRVAFSVRSATAAFVAAVQAL
ncbi:MAG TPA: SCO family protein [Longimicrobiales bacterium]